MIRTDNLKVVRRMSAYAVAKNTDTGKYELWLMCRGEFFEQCDIFDDREDAIDSMKWEVKDYARFLSEF